MTNCTEVILGASVELSATFEQDGQRKNPSTIALVVTNTYTGTATTYQKSDLSVTADYVFSLIYTPSEAGEHTARFTSTTPNGAMQTNFVVLP